MSQYMGLFLNDQLNTFSWEVALYNDWVIFIEVVISILVGSSLYVCLFNKWQQKFSHWEILEIIWSLVPAFVLIWMGIPSIKILQGMEMLNNESFLNLKIVGHQWYWEYNFPEFKIKVDCFPITGKIFRLLETSSTVVLPFNCNVQVLITSFDVIHSWTLPSMGIKMDACPGRLNFFMMNTIKPGIYVGQCSELCGSFHHMMPIYLEISSPLIFSEWIKMNL